MKFLFVLFIVLNFSFYSETLRIANGYWPPYMPEKEKDYGFISKAVSNSFYSEGIKIEYGFFPWIRAYYLAKTNQWDGTIGWAKTKEREEIFYFSQEPLFEGDIILFYNNSKPITVNTLEDLKKYKIGITSEYSYGSSLDKFIKTNPKNFEVTFSDLNNFNKLLAGRIDGFAIDLDVGLFFLKDNFSKEDISRLSYTKNSLDHRYYYLLLYKNNKNKILMQNFDTGFKKTNSKVLIQNEIISIRKSIIK